jgi:uncharacterized protein involved in exopolysaccharide biosynthesis
LAKPPDQRQPWALYRKDTGVEEINQSLRGYLRIFFRRKWLIIVPVFFGLIAGICASILLPRAYKSSTTILVQEGKTDNPLFNNLAVSSTITQRSQAIHEIILGWDSLSKLIKRLNLDKQVKSSLEYEKLIARLRKDILINLREGNIIDLDYTSGSPQMSQAVVQTVTDIFIDRNVSFQNKETTDAIKFIEEQLHVYRGKIKSAEIAALKDKLNILLVDSTENHPMVRELRAQINKKMQELKDENLEYSEDKRLGNETTGPMIDQIKKTLDSITADKSAPLAPNSVKVPVPDEERDIYKVMLIDKLDNVMARDVSVNETIYNSLLQRLETAKITQRLQSSKEGTKYIILNPPQIPLKPVQPNVALVVFLGIVLGALIGGSLVFLYEFLDRSFLDVQEASQFLGVSLLGSISKLHTPDFVKASRRKNQWIAFCMTVVGVLIILVTVKIRILSKT